MEVLNMRVEAPIKVDRKTKRLAKRLTGGEIAVINHIDNCHNTQHQKSGINICGILL